MYKVRISWERQNSKTDKLYPVLTLVGSTTYPRSIFRHTPIDAVPINILFNPEPFPDDTPALRWIPKDVPSPPLGVQEIPGPGVTAIKRPAGSVRLLTSTQ